MELNLADIQGLILRGYTMAFQRHFLLGVQNAQAARRLIGRLASGDPAVPQITSSAPWTVKPPTTLTLGITFEGLKALGLSSDSLASFPAEFVRGPGDSGTAQRVGNTGESAPEKWIEPLAWNPGVPAPIHIILFLAAQDETARDAATVTLIRLLGEQDAFTLLTTLDGADLPGSRVHFGYLDGLSQPRIAGGPSPGYPDDQPPAPPGEFLLGYESQFPSFTYPTPMPPALGTNGSFGAYGVLKQDVDAFEAFLKQAAATTGRSEEWVAAKMCGRWRNGVPLSLSPDTDMPDPPLTPDNWNQFDYAPTPDNPDIVDDSRGVRCPIGSHIRRSNPRSGRVAGDGGHTHRLLRRGIPYGPPYDSERPTDGMERGLLGMFLCVSLRDQFEFVMAEWINGDAFGLLGDRDPLVADNDTGNRRLRIPLPDATGPLIVSGLSRFVATRGSAYCFLPSLTALNYIAGL